MFFRARLGHMIGFQRTDRSNLPMDLSPPGRYMIGSAGALPDMARTVHYYNFLGRWRPFCGDNFSVLKVLV